MELWYQMNSLEIYQSNQTAIFLSFSLKKYIDLSDKLLTCTTLGYHTVKQQLHKPQTPLPQSLLDFTTR